MMWLVLNVYVAILSIIILIKIGLPKKNQIIISLIFGLLMFLAYQGVSLTSLKTFFVTFLCALATFKIFEKHNEHSLKFIKSTVLKSIIASLIIGLVSGLVLGAINLFLAQEILTFQFELSALFTALSPAIFEEIAFRAFLYAFCIYLLNGNINSKAKGFGIYQ